MMFCARNIRPGRKGIYIAKNMLSPKLILSYRLGLGIASWQLTQPKLLSKISHYK